MKLKLPVLDTTEISVDTAKLLDINDYSKCDPDIAKLLRRIDALQIENFNLKNEVSYYERYLKFLEDNYIFILKSLKCAKDLFNMIEEKQSNE